MTMLASGAYMPFLKGNTRNEVTTHRNCWFVVS